MRSIAWAGAILGLLAPLASAAELGVRNGDVVVYIGDFVTEEYSARNTPDRLSYPTHVEAFLTVRYGDIHLTHYNAGMAESTAAGTLERLERDVLPLKPTVAVICLGLEEAGLGAQPFTDENLASHRAAMEKIVAALKKAGCRVYVMSPPSVDEQVIRQLAEKKYNETLGKIAAAQKELATAAGAVYVPWFEASMEARAKALQSNPSFAFARDPRRQTDRSQAFAASLILEALHAEPIDVHIAMDWDTGKVDASVPDVKVEVDGGKRTITAPKLPLPWPSFAGQLNNLAGGWEADKWCRYTLQVHGVPGIGLMASGGSGAREVPLIGQQLAQGMSMAILEPLRSLQATQDVFDLIRRKNYTRTHAWRDQELTPVQEPELLDAQKTLISAWYKYFHGYGQLLAKAPKTFDLHLELRELQLPGATTAPTVPGQRPGATLPPPQPNE